MNFNLSQIDSVAVMVIEKAEERSPGDRATVVALDGDLGAGKTTLVAEIGRQLGVADAMQSPTFGIYKRYPTGGGRWKYLVHGDMYRLDSADDIRSLGWDALLADPENLVCVEWPERIAGAVPMDAVRVSLGHAGEESRTIDFI